jgi:Xaa-Pro aminopeptidase
MNEDAFAVFIPITAIVMTLLIPIVYAITDYRRRRDIVEAHHKERLAAIERGMEIPPLPEAFFKPMEKAGRPRHLLTGMIWLFLGLSVGLLLNAVADSSVAFVGLIPAGVGAAFLIYYFVEGRNELAEYKARDAAREAARTAALEHKVS